MSDGYAHEGSASTENVRAARYSDLFENGHRHTSDCAYCPICTGISILRRAEPEVLDHLAGAVRELLLAAALVLEKAGEGIPARDPIRARKESGSAGKLRRIDLA